MLTTEDRYHEAMRLVRDHGHIVLIQDWVDNAPTPKRAYAVCHACGGTIEIREDGAIVWPGATPICDGLLRAEAEMREGISDYYADQEMEDTP